MLFSGVNHAFPCQPRLCLQRSINTQVKAGDNPLASVAKANRERWEPSSMSGLDCVSSQEASVASEVKMQEMREKIEVLERTIEEQRLRAERDAPRTRVEGGGGGGGERRSTCEAAKAVDCAGTWAGSPIRHVTTFFYRPNLTQSRPPKFDNI